MELFYCEGITARVQAYGLLALAVRQRWGTEALPRLARSKSGKPFFPEVPHCHFNLSHSGGVAACVLDDRPAGVDAEHLRLHHPRLPQRICSPAELVWLHSQPDPDRALCQLWTRKECRVKLDGTGLTVPIRSISVPLPPPQEDCTQHDGLTFFTLDGPAWVISACGHSPLTAVTPIDVNSLPPVIPCFVLQNEKNSG